MGLEVNRVLSHNGIEEVAPGSGGSGLGGGGGGGGWGRVMAVVRWWQVVAVMLARACARVRT